MEIPGIMSPPVYLACSKLPLRQTFGKYPYHINIAPSRNEYPLAGPDPEAYDGAPVLREIRVSPLHPVLAATSSKSSATLKGEAIP